MRIHLRKVVTIFIGFLREVSDQNAYARHLAAHNLQASPEAWRSFSDERFRTKYQRAKCC
jgi:hypothetical protein